MWGPSRRRRIDAAVKSGLREECKIRERVITEVLYRSDVKRAAAVSIRDLLICMHTGGPDEFEQARSTRKLHRHRNPVTVKILRVDDVSRR